MRNILHRILAVTIASVACLGVVADDFTIDNICYGTIDDSSVKILYSGSAKGDVVIPETVTNDGKTYTVVAVDDQAFFFVSGLKSIELPATVRTLGVRSFYQTSLTHIILPEGLTSIGVGCFIDNLKLKLVEIPASIQEIGLGAFLGCKYMETLKVANPDPASIEIGDTAFGEVPFASCVLKVPAGSKERYQAAEVWNQFVNIEELPDGDVEQLDPVDFEATNADGVKLHYKSHPEKGRVVYVAQSWSYEGDIVIPETVKYQGITYTVTGLEAGAFMAGGMVTSVEMPNTITELGNYALASKSLTSVTLSPAIRVIPDYLFYNCGALTEVEIPEGVVQIGNMVFGSCDKLETVYLPSTLQILNQAFSINQSVREIYINVTDPGTLTYANSFILSYDPKSRWNNIDCAKCKLYVPEGSKALYENHIIWCGFGPAGGNDNVVEHKFSGVGALAAETKLPTEYYNLNGIQIDGSQLTPGVYIERSAKGARKIIIK